MVGTKRPARDWRRVVDANGECYVSRPDGPSQAPTLNLSLDHHHTAVLVRHEFQEKVFKFRPSLSSELTKVLVNSIFLYESGTRTLFRRHHALLNYSIYPPTTCDMRERNF